MAAVKKGPSANTYAPGSRRKRKGVHSKKGTSKVKTSKLYKKLSRGQG